SPVLLWATDRAAYGRLAKLLTVGRRAAPKGECRLIFDDVAAHAAGLLAGVVLTNPQVACDSATSAKPQAALRHYHDVFSDRCYAVAELHRVPTDRQLF